MNYRSTRRRAAHLLGILTYAWAAGAWSAPNIDPEAGKVLRAMSDALQAAPMFSVRIDARTTSGVQGKTKVADTTTKMTVGQPNLLRLELEAEDDRGLIVSDGETLYSYFPRVNRYLAEEAPLRLADSEGTQGTIQRSLAASMAGIDMLSVLLSESPYQDLVEGVVSVDYLGKETVNGADAHRIRFRQEQIDFDLWITSESPVALVRVVPDLSRTLQKMAEMRPDRPPQEIGIEVQLADWSFQDETTPGLFSWTPPPEARAIRRMDELAAATPGPTLKGERAPDLGLPLLGGGRLDLSEHRDQSVVVLCFWVTWAGGGEVLLPELAALADTYRDHEVVFYSVNLRESGEAVQRFLEAHALDVPVALDREGSVGAAYRVTTVPQTFFIDPHGQVSDVMVGAIPQAGKKAGVILDRLVKARSPAPTP